MTVKLTVFIEYSRSRISITQSKYKNMIITQINNNTNTYYIYIDVTFQSLNNVELCRGVFQR